MGMSRTVTLRLSDQAYLALKTHAENDGVSMNAWVEGVLDAEDLRRRCAAHEEWMAANPDAVAFAEAWADQNLDELAGR